MQLCAANDFLFCQNENRFLNEMGKNVWYYLVPLLSSCAEQHTNLTTIIGKRQIVKHLKISMKISMKISPQYLWGNARTWNVHSGTTALLTTKNHAQVVYIAVQVTHVHQIKAHSECVVRKAVVPVFQKFNWEMNASPLKYT